jgi:phosphoribosylformylglycinamidine cyclo-ligase
MNSKRPRTYAESGVDISAEEEAIRALRRHFKTKKKGRGSPINIEGAYAGLLDMGDFIIGITTDGVGSKVLVATEMQNWRTIGIDCMAMNVNDLYAMGLEPMAFVDYLAMESIEPSIADQIGQGLAKGAKIANVSIVGGETASLPEIVMPKADRMGSSMKQMMLSAYGRNLAICQRAFMAVLFTTTSANSSL